MRRFAAILVLVATLCSGTSLAEWVHVTLDHAHHADEHDAHDYGYGYDYGHDHDHGPTLGDAHAAADGHDCGLCAALHAPSMPTPPLYLSVQMSLASERAVTLQVQRLDASVPLPRGCRGPPLI